MTEGRREKGQVVCGLSGRAAARLPWSVCALSLSLTALSLLLLDMNFSHQNTHTYDYWLENTIGALSYAPRGKHKPLGTRGGVSEALRVNVLGGFKVSVGSRVVEKSAWQLRKAASLVKVLSLWPHLDRKAASNNLRRALHVARRALESEPSAPRYLVSHGEHLALCPDGNLWVDIEAFEEAAATARRSRDPAAYRVALDLYAGDLLPEDPYEDWVEDRRRQLRQNYLDLLV
jgi:hypothetical protein